MKIKPLYKLMILVFIVAMAFWGIKGYLDNQLDAKDPASKQEEVFIINQGESVSSIAKRLESAGLIKSANAFTIFVKNSNMSSKIQAGDFKLSPSMDAKEVLRQLTVGVIDKWVTLLEGWRVEEVAQKLNSELGISSSEFMAVAKEGYMFPDTYLFNQKATAADIAQTMRNNFNKKYDDQLQTKIKKNGLTSEQGVILASIVEREARSDEVRKMVASILLKRLKINMGLNADATIQYALVKQGSKNPPDGGWWKRNLTRDDLKVDSPYNTYIHAGLPPTPISNPSLSSLQAVANADSSTPYLYYYHDSKGNSYYARTLDEHNQNVANHP